MGAYNSKKTLDFGGKTYTIERLVGRGAFGKVYAILNKESGEMELLAMKQLSKRLLMEKASVVSTLRERRFLSDLYHPLIVNLRGSFQNDTHLLMILDFMKGGDIAYHLDNAPESRFSEAQVKFYMSNIVLALEYVHGAGVMHRDIKPDNVMLDAAGYAYLTDFNVGKRVEKDGMVTGYAGTFAYMAPELFYAKGTRYSTTVDVWSLGVLMYRMLFGVVPWRMQRKASEQEYLDAHADEYNHRAPKNDKVRQETIRWILRGKIHVPTGVSADAADLMHHMIALPDKRFTIEQCKAHAFFADVDWQAVYNKTAPSPFTPAEKANVDAGIYVEDVFAAKTKEVKLMPEEHYLFYDWNWVKQEFLDAEQEAVDAGTFKRRKKPSKRSIVRRYPQVLAMQERVHRSKRKTPSSSTSSSSGAAASSSATTEEEEEEVQIKPVPELGRQVRVGDQDLVDVRSLNPAHFDDMSSSSTACSSQDHSVSA